MWEPLMYLKWVNPWAQNLKTEPILSINYIGRELHVSYFGREVYGESIYLSDKNLAWDI